MKMRKDRLVISVENEKLIIGTSSPVSVRGGSNLGLRSPVRGRSPLPNVGREIADDEAFPVAIESFEQPSRGVEIIDQLNEHIRDWSFSGESTHSDDTRSTAPETRSTTQVPRSTVQDTRSTTPLAYDTILRHQKKESKDSGRLHTAGREFTPAELQWLDYVVQELYTLIVEKALDTNSGVQYRNTFAWRFKVHAPLP
jgi:hypothetical protein